MKYQRSVVIFMIILITPMPACSMFNGLVSIWDQISEGTKEFLCTIMDSDYTNDSPVAVSKKNLIKVLNINNAIRPEVGEQVQHPSEIIPTENDEIVWMIMAIFACSMIKQREENRAPKDQNLLTSSSSVATLPVVRNVSSKKFVTPAGILKRRKPGTLMGRNLENYADSSEPKFGSLDSSESDSSSSQDELFKMLSSSRFHTIPDDEYGASSESDVKKLMHKKKTPSPSISDWVLVPSSKL